MPRHTLQFWQVGKYIYVFIKRKKKKHLPAAYLKAEPEHASKREREAGRERASDPRGHAAHAASAEMGNNADANTDQGSAVSVSVRLRSRCEAAIVSVRLRSRRGQNRRDARGKMQVWIRITLRSRRRPSLVVVQSTS
jgi:hypothetical protein